MKQIKEGDYSTSGWLHVTKVETLSPRTMVVTVRDLQGKGEGRREQMRAFAKKVVADQKCIESTETVQYFREGNIPAIKFFITLKEQRQD